MRRSILLLILIFVSTVYSKNSEYIPAEKIFTNPTASAYYLSKNGDYLIGRYLGDELGYLELLDTKEFVSEKLVDFDYKDRAAVTDYRWLSDTQVFVTGVSQGSKRSYIQEIDFSKDKIEIKTKPVPSHFVILSKYVNDNNQLWVVEKTLRGSILLLMTPEQILNINTEDAIEFENALDGAITYSLDERGKPAYSFTIEEDDVYLWFLNDQDTWVKVYGILGASTSFSVVGQLSNGKLAVLSNENTDKVVLVEFDLNTKEYGDILYEHSMYDLETATINASGEVEYVGFIDHGIMNYLYFGLENKAKQEKIEKMFPGKEIVISSTAGSKVVAYVYSSGDTGRIFLIDLEKNSKRLLKYRYVQHKGLNMAVTKVSYIKSRDGEQIETYFTPAAKHSDLDVLLVMPHGGPIGIRDKNDYDPLVQFLSNRGYSILRVNFSGSDGFGKKHIEQGRGQFGLKIERDIADAVKSLQKKYNFSKRCAIGFSYGGYSSLMLAIDAPNEYQCVVGGMGVYDLNLLFNDSNLALHEQVRSAVENVVGEENDDLQMRSPVNLIDKLTAPALIIAGKEDQIARIEHSNRLKYMLTSKGKAFEYLFYNKTGHGHSSWNWDKHQAITIDRFIRRTLNLPQIKNTELTAEEALYLASAYSFTDKVDRDPKKEVALYREAAEGGIGNAAFNLGAHYHRGDGVEKSMAEAIRYYKKADKLNYESAGYRLYQIFSDSESEYHNPELAKKYLIRSADLKHQEATRKYVLEACDLKDEKFSVEYCFKYLNYVDGAETPGLEVIQEIAHAFYSNANTQRASQIVEFFHKNYQLKVDKVRIQMRSEIVIEDGESGKLFRDVNQKLEIPNELEAGYKVFFDIQSDEREDYKKLVPVMVNWSRTSENGDKVTLISSLKIYEVGSEFYLVYRLVDESELVAGEYSLELIDMNQNEIFKREFIID